MGGQRHGQPDLQHLLCRICHGDERADWLSFEFFGIEKQENSSTYAKTFSLLA